MTTERERRENRHRSNLNNPNNPEFGRGFNEPGIPPQPAQARSGEGRPDRIDEGRGHAPPRGRKGSLEGEPGTVIVDPTWRPEVTTSTVGSSVTGGFGRDLREDREHGFGSLGSPYSGSIDTFFAQIQQSGALPGGASVKEVAAAVLGILAQRLSGGEVRALQDSLLPEIAVLLRREGEFRAEEGEVFGRQELILRVARQLQLGDADAEAVARAVLLALRAQLPAHKIHAVESQLPSDLVNLWHTKEARERVRERIGSAGGG